MDDKLPFDDPRYQIPGIPGSFNLSKWMRENEPRAEHKFAVGDVVVFTIVTEVMQLTRDCDGEPLISMAALEGWWCQDDARAATDDEKRNY